MIRVGAFTAAAVATPLAALAGPPYVTDDPAPTEPGGWEVYAFGEGRRPDGAIEGEVGLDINYGAAPDLQLTLVLPMAVEDAGRSHAGAGDVEFAAKWRFLRQGERTPDVAVFPAITLPTGDPRFSEGEPTLFLPLWAQKDFGAWSVFGGGGYRIRQGRDVWEAGVAVTRAVGSRLSLGARSSTRHLRSPPGGPTPG